MDKKKNRRSQFDLDGMFLDRYEEGRDKFYLKPLFLSDEETAELAAKRWARIEYDYIMRDK